MGGETVSWPAWRQLVTRDGWNPVLRYVLVQDERTLDAMISALGAIGTFAWDTETSGLKPELGARICGHAFCARTGERELTGWYVPVRHIGPMNDHDVQLAPELVADKLRQLFAGGHGEVRTYHAKFDRKMARADGLELRRAYADVAIAATAANENEPRFGLKFLAEKYMTDQARGEEEGLKDWMRKDARTLGLSFDKHSKKKIKALGGVVAAALTPTYKQRFGYARTPIRLCGVYAVHDVAYTWWLLEVKYASTRWEFRALWEREHAVSDELFEMEWHGLAADEHVIRDAHERSKHAVQHWLDECRKLCPEFIDETFEASGEELRELLYEKLKLDPPKFTKRDKKPSADAEARQLLERTYPAQRPLLRAIGNLADVLKLYNTYTASFLRFYSPTTKAIHPSYNQLEQRGEGGVPVTGRLSSADPNAQNISGETLHLWDCHCSTCLKDEAKEAAAEGRAVRKDEMSVAARSMRGMPVENTISVRRYFVVPEDHVRVYIDFSQIELRILAWFCQDPNLLRAYIDDLDVHAMVAEQLGISRKVAKQVNFGNSYGMTEIGLALRMAGYYDDPEGTREEAKKVLEAYFKKYARILAFRREFSLEMRRNACSFVNPFGRPRRIPEIVASERWEREAAERKMMSSIISGTAADLMKESMRRTSPIAAGAGGRLVQTIHDELVYDIPRRAGWARTVVSMVRAMEDWPQFSQTRHGRTGVPIKTNVALTTTRWEDKREIKVYADNTFAWAS
jgi:DNA polymerase-1